MNAVVDQFTQLKDQHPDAALTPLPDGSTLVVVPGARVPIGWNQKQSTVAFVIPSGFPTARPDCFWSDSTLLLENGTAPANSNPQIPPGSAAMMRWFSWHLVNWNPNRDTVYTYFDFCIDRFRQPR